ncbi:MAG: amylo-alpha-1,6-glucosidase [Planctomycetota bacterium]
MLLRRSSRDTTVSLTTTGRPTEELLNREWLLTNKRGDFASGSVTGCNTRKYHGTLVGSLCPPINRIVSLSACQETIITRKYQQSLSVFEFADSFVADGLSSLKSFRRDIGVHFDHELEGIELTKSIYLHPDHSVVAIVYDFRRVASPLEFVLRPLIALRDFHSLQTSYAHLYAVWVENGISIRHNIPHSCQLFLQADDMWFEHDCQWWFSFMYRKDKQRGLPYCEDLWTPGFYKCQIDYPRRIALWAYLSRGEGCCSFEFPFLEQLCEQLRQNQADVLAALPVRTECLKKLWLAADQFIVQRQQNSRQQTTTILAGYPWFADWGRDTFISLPGLLLVTQRFDEAKSVMTTFAQAIDEGMIPNRFDDYSNKAYYNSIDASLWFINSAFEYLYASGNENIFQTELLPVIREIVENYRKGTKFNIHADSDGLITGGNAETQLTWMDAKHGETAFTPRYGKAVEVNALWFNALCSLAAFYRQRKPELAEYYEALANQAAGSFVSLFWNDSADCLYDCILPDGTADAGIRPNQIFAVSLPFSPLSPDKQKQVVEKVRQDLLTPYGLRSLAKSDKNYKGHYCGSVRDRDEAYHQGTVWAHLIGPFVEANLRINNFSKKNRKEGFRIIEPLLHHLRHDACLGSVSEIFDGDPPHEPRGCFAQAWAVAELIRAYKLVHN